MIKFQKTVGRGEISVGAGKAMLGAPGDLLICKYIDEEKFNRFFSEIQIFHLFLEKEEFANFLLGFS